MYKIYNIKEKIDLEEFFEDIINIEYDIYQIKDLPSSVLLYDNKLNVFHEYDMKFHILSLHFDLVELIGEKYASYFDVNKFLNKRISPRLSLNVFDPKNPVATPYNGFSKIKLVELHKLL